MNSSPLDPKAMHTNCRRARVLICLVVFGAHALAARPAAAGRAPQQKDAKEEAAATVSGRVSLDGRGAAGVYMLLLPADAGPDGKIVARARTDSEGQYRLTGIAPGRYRVTPSAPAHVVAEWRRGDWSAAGFVMLEAGEEVEDINFTLARGGVITGRVADADGGAIVGESVRLQPLEPSRGERTPAGRQMYQTDDRGVYRIYGLRAGRYKVYVGIDTSNSYSGIGSRPRGYYVRTFHPDTSDAARARVVEVSEGGEAAGVDITLGVLRKTYKVSGRVLNAATAEPVAGAQVSYGVVVEQGARRLVSGARVKANERGEFHFEGVTPGRYGAHSPNDNASEFYSDVTNFEVADADLSGVEVKLHTGSSLSGVVAVEGATDGALAARLSRELSLVFQYDTRQGVIVPSYERIRVGPDGGFRMTGLRPGRIHIRQGYPPVEGLSLARVELNGVEQRGGVEVAEAAHVTGVRLVFTYGTGRVRGQITFRVGGQEVALPPHTRVTVIARRPGGEGRPLLPRPADADARGRFVVEGLPAGEVELLVNASGQNSRVQVRQLVNVSDGGETNVTLTLDLDQPPPRPQPRRPPGER